MRRLPRFANAATFGMRALMSSEYSIDPSVPRKLDITRSALRWVSMVHYPAITMWIERAVTYTAESAH